MSAAAVKEELAAKDAQRAGAKRATFDKLRSKRRAELEFSTSLSTAAGPEEVSFLFRSMGSVAYDELITRHPPTTAQKAKNHSFNMDTFAPVLLSRVCAEPSMSVAEWSEIWTSEDWNQGEVSALFWTAVELCNRGLDVNPTGAVSG